MKVSIKFEKQAMRNVRIALMKDLKGVEESAMQAALDALLKDALDETPSCPIDTGKLYNSHETKIVKGERLIGIIGVKDVPYATYVHEGIHGQKADTVIRYTRPGSGPKWIEAKMRRYREKYFKIMQDKIYK